MSAPTEPSESQPASEATGDARAGANVATSDATRDARAWRRGNVLVLGLVSLFTDAASDMVVPLLPVFLLSVGAGALALGWIEGLAEGLASLLKVVSGRAADRTGRYRPLVRAGYTLSSIAKPVVALATAPWHVLTVRLLDRTGKGLRSSPRDALIAGSVPAAQRGAAFGLHRAMDHAGAVLGPLVAFAVLHFVTRDLRVLFALSAIPGVLVLALVWGGVREVRVESGPKPASVPLSTDERRRLLAVLAPIVLFTLGNASDLFLLMKASQTNSPLESLPLLWVGLHVVKMAASLPAGWLSDKLGRRRIVALGWVVYALVYVGFAFAEQRAVVWGLFVVYGLYHGLTEGVEKALVADVAPAHARGTAFGWYHGTMGVAAMLASGLFGMMWHFVGAQAAFLTSASIALVAVIVLGATARFAGASQVD